MSNWRKRISRFNWNFVLPIGLLVAAAFIASWLLREKPSMSRTAGPPPAPLVEVATAERGQYPVTVEALGLVRARETVDLEPQVQGSVEWLDYELDQGSTVPAGRLLAKIDPEPYQLALRTAGSTLAERRAELQQELGQQQVAEEEYELLGRSLPDADRALVLREPQLAMAQARVAAAEVAVSLAERDLRLTEIRSPLNALLVSRSVDIGDRVGPGSVLYRLAGTDVFQIAVEIPAVQLSRLRREGAEVRIHGSQWPEGRYRRGRLIRLIPVLEEQGRLARVLVELEDPLALELVSEPRLLLNDLARVVIVSPPERDRVRIPLTALQDGGRVWIVRDGRIEVRPVELAYLSGDYAVLEAGLNGGEALVTTRLNTVTDGMRVRQREAPEGGGEGGKGGDSAKDSEAAAAKEGKHTGEINKGETKGTTPPPAGVRQ
ncbi:multidrug resistance protein MdtA [Microbulbifer aestuariivivens]|uniref:Multidrug resistance protein MdtA n=1 Tax=Microbulbifer aestuariivivens TaxID=1908308 RepID=A0ABP9WN51_9GAMM